MLAAQVRVSAMILTGRLIFDPPMKYPRVDGHDSDLVFFVWA
jgi:hypothetical protein